MEDYVLWKCINKLSKREDIQRKPLLELHINGRLCTDSTEIANEFNRYFIQSVEELALCFEPIQLPQNAINDTPSSFYISEVDEDKIFQIINQLNNSRAKDIFGMDTAFVKKYSVYLLKPLVNLINLSIREGKFPSNWKTSIIIPIFKAGSVDEVQNYRPISILPAISKILEKLVAEQLINYLEKHDLLHSKQFGFRPKYSTEMANCFLTEFIKGALDNGNVVGAVFLDLKKAFDTVNHEILLHKLNLFSFSQQTINWFRSYLESRDQLYETMRWVSLKGQFWVHCCFPYTSMIYQIVASKLNVSYMQMTPSFMYRHRLHT